MCPAAAAESVGPGLAPTVVPPLRRFCVMVVSLPSLLPCLPFLSQPPSSPDHALLSCAAVLPGGTGAPAMTGELS